VVYSDDQLNSITFPDLEVSVLECNQPPTAEANGDYFVAGGSTVGVTGVGSTDPDFDVLTFSWDMNDGNGFSTPSASPLATFDAAALTGPDGVVITLEVCDTSDACDQDTATVNILNNPPDCSAVVGSITAMWPPNHKFHSVDVTGVTDSDGDSVTVSLSVWQDEPVDTFGDGSFTPDAIVVDSDTVELRAERSGSKKVPGNGRVYTILVSAEDSHGDTCSSDAVTVGVPHDQGKRKNPVNDGPLYDSTALLP